MRSSSITPNIGVLLGPAMSGLGIALIGAQNVLYVNAGTFFVSALFLLPICVRHTRVSGDLKAVSTPIIQDMMVGFRFVFLQQRVVFGLMITAVLYNLAISAFVFLFPVVAKELLQVGPMELGWFGGQPWVLACWALPFGSREYHKARSRIGSEGLAVRSQSADWLCAPWN